MRGCIGERVLLGCPTKWYNNFIRKNTTHEARHEDNITKKTCFIKSDIAFVLLLLRHKFYYQYNFKNKYWKAFITADLDYPISGYGQPTLVLDFFIAYLYL